MAGDFPKFEYTMGDVRRAGDALRGLLFWTDESADSIREVFHIANNYRDSHAYPMRRVRHEISGQIKRQKLVDSFTVARLKRMPSIRRKLRAISSDLNQIQDLAGCRAVLPDMEGVDALIAAMRERSAHTLTREDPYITDPKPDGYRSHHMVYKFNGTGDEEVYKDRRVEIQIRTRLQHSWATAVEAVGLFRREDMKAGQGNPEWLKLFKLMSAQFMLAEGCPLANDDANARQNEIIGLNKQVNALQTLEDLRQAVKITEAYQFDLNNKPDYFLIRYERESNRVTVRGQWGPIPAMESYDSAESIDPKQTNSGFNSVLVEVDEIENLKAAYPNYFGDVEIFMGHLKAIVGDTGDFQLTPQPVAPKRQREKPDYLWLKRRW